MGNQMVEFGGIFIRDRNIYLAVVRSEQELDGLSCIGARRDGYYYLGIASATNTNAVNKLNALPNQDTALVDFDYLRDVLSPALPGPASWMESMPKKASLKEIANTIALVTHLA